MKQHITPEEDSESFPISNDPNVKDNDVLLYMTEQDNIVKTYSDLTGRFPIQSSRGNSYILVAYHPDANEILVETMKNRNSASIINA